jgi:hypothetical protein
MSCEGNTCCKMMPWQKTWPWALAALDGEKLSLYRAFLVCCEHALALAWARPTSNWFQRCIFAYTLYMNLHTYIPVYLPTCIPRYLLTYLPVHTYIPSYLHTYISHTNTPTYSNYHISKSTCWIGAKWVFDTMLVCTLSVGDAKCIARACHQGCIKCPKLPSSFW